MDASIIDYFQELTGLGRQTCISIFDQHFPNLQVWAVDFHVVICKALSLKLISPRKACVGSMIHLTGLKSERVTSLIDFGDPEAPHDLNQAIIRASVQLDIDRSLAVTARMRALTMLSQSRAQFFLGQTSPQGYLESAIAKARVANEITPDVAAMAQLKILTGFGDELANRLLTGHGDIERAIVQGENAFKIPAQYTLARLRARFSLMEQDAREVLTKQSVNGNFEKACSHVKADKVMANVIVDTQDALDYLQQANDNVDNAIKLAQRNLLAKSEKRPLEDITDGEFAAWQARHPEAVDQEFGDRTGGYGSTRRGLKSSLVYLAKGYMKSFPGPRSSPSNMGLQNEIELFFAGCYTDDDYEAIERIRSQVLYRTWMMRSANNYRLRMNLNKIKPIQAWNEEFPGSDNIMPLAIANFPIVRRSGLFPRPDASKGYWGRVWHKPFRYLAWAFAASGYGPDDIPKYLQLLKQTQ